MLKELKCAVSSNILSQPLELQCGTLVCTKCLWEWTAASGAVNCPCCSEGDPLVSSHVRPAPGVILLLLSNVATYVALVHGEENPLAVDLLKQSAAKKEICEGNCMQVSSI